MRLRGYIEDIDFKYIQSWVQEERVHALWCANTFSYPLQLDNFRDVLRKNAVDWMDSAYTITEDDGEPIGFFAYNVNGEKDYGFLKFVLLDRNLRGSGYGSRMIHLICKSALDMSGVSAIRLNVFDVNKAAIRCYEKEGFILEKMEKDVFAFQGEKWGRCLMIHTVSRDLKTADCSL